MAYQVYFDSNKPCFLKELYLIFKENLQNERSLFDVDIHYVTQINFFPFSNKLLSQIPLKPLKILACYSLPISHLIPFSLFLTS